MWVKTVDSTYINSTSCKHTRVVVLTGRYVTGFPVGSTGGSDLRMVWTHINEEQEKVSFFYGKYLSFRLQLN